MAEKKKKALMNLNMGIAHAHEVATQLVGMQLSSANILALCVSALSVVAGTVSVAVMNYPQAYPLWVIAGVVGVGLALLIEGLTLGALIRIRLASKNIREINAKFDAARDEKLAKIPEPELDSNLKIYKASVRTYKAAIKLVEQDYRRKKSNATREHRHNRTSSYPIAFFGALASACAGGLFYHTILSNLPVYESIGLSALFALVVTGTFVSSELFKEVQEQAIKEGFAGGSLAESAIKQETKRLAYQGVYNHSMTYLDTQEATQMIQEGFKVILQEVIRELHPDTKSVVIEESEMTQSLPQASSPSLQIGASQDDIEITVEDDTPLFFEMTPEITEEVTPEDTNEITEPVNSEMTPQPRITAKLDDAFGKQERNTDKLKSVTKKRKQNVTSIAASGDAAKKIRRMVLRNRNISPAEIARQVGVSRPYASKIKSQVLAELEQSA